VWSCSDTDFFGSSARWHPGVFRLLPLHRHQLLELRYWRETRLEQTVAIKILPQFE
jgi:hypothetical protein